MALFDKTNTKEAKSSSQSGGKKSPQARLQELARLQGALEEREKQLARNEARVEKEKEKTEQLKKELFAKLEKVAKISQEEARKLVLESTERKLKVEVARKIKEAEEEIKETAQKKAQQILIEAMKHGAVDWTAEYTVSTIRLPDEEIKGRIIGREGRNIRTFEQATGVEIELDETLDLRLSSFDSVRREIARLALEKLIKDGRIQPGRIEEAVVQTKKQIDQVLFEEGKKLCHSVGVYNLHPDLMKMLGRYKFRFSYGQNMIIHTLEETKIGLAIAEELKADINIVRLGCLLHDIGKVVTEEEGSHVQLGADLLKKFSLPKEVIACVEEHHEDRPFSSIESAIIWVADAISGSRPGARYVPHEEYLKRMTNIEEVARSFSGVEEVAAYQAGREVRIIVKPEEVSDDELVILAKKISEKLEEDAKWAGQIKVVVIRETRATEVAK